MPRATFQPNDKPNAWLRLATWFATLVLVVFALVIVLASPERAEPTRTYTAPAWLVPLAGGSDHPDDAYAERFRGTARELIKMTTDSTADMLVR